MTKRLQNLLFALVLVASLVLSGCGVHTQDSASDSGYRNPTVESGDAADDGRSETAGTEQDASSGDPSFTQAEISYAEQHLGYESYSKLDYLGRCGKATACLGPETMPDVGEERGSIGMVKPSGWHTVKYDNVDGKYLYNRCHLIGWQLGAENANERNLVTGTRWMNTQEMLPYEDEVADYIRSTGNHVLYRATPLFEGSELVCRGIRLEALSLEDGGRGVSFNAYCPNAQPDISIDYATGNSKLESGAGHRSGGFSSTGGSGTSSTAKMSYVLNTNTMKFHEPGCSSVDDMKAENRKNFKGSREEVIEMGYSPCGRCNP